MTIQNVENPEKLVLRSSSGCVCLFLLLFGTIVTVSVFVPVEVRGGDEFPWYVGLPLGIGLLLGGTYRKTVTLNSLAGRLDVHYRIAGYVFNASYRDLSDFDNVSFIIRRRKTPNGRGQAYYVTLGGAVSFDIETGSVVASGRKRAVQVARFLGLPLHDSLGGRCVVYQPGQHGMSVRERSEQTGKREAVPDAPAEMLTSVEVLQGVGATFHIPSPGWSLRVLMSVLPICAFGLFLLWIACGGWQTIGNAGELVIGVVALLAGSLLIFGPLASIAEYATRRFAIDVSSEQVQIKSVSILRSRTMVVAASSIENVFVNAGHASGRARSWNDIWRGGISIRTDRDTYRFGRHLPTREREFLQKLVLAILQS